MRMVKPTRLSGWVNRLLGHHDPWWKGLFLPKDRWWKMSPLEADMNAVVEETVNELEAYGIAWLENPGHNTQR